MSISLPELCKELGIRNTTSEEYMPGNGVFAPKNIPEGTRPYSEVANLFDGFALVLTEKLAPIISQHIEGAPNALELGSGPGLRVLFYAMNNPKTQFYAIDQDPRAVAVLVERSKKLGLKNLRTRIQDNFDDKLLKEKYACVTGIDCLDAPPEDMICDTSNFEYIAFGRFCSLVDSTKTPHFYATLEHGPSIEESQGVIDKLLSQYAESTSHGPALRAYAEQEGLNTFKEIPINVEKEGVHYNSKLYIVSR